MSEFENDLLDLLCKVLPFLEDAEEDPCYKDGAVAVVIRRVLVAIKTLEEKQTQSNTIDRAIDTIRELTKNNPLPMERHEQITQVLIDLIAMKEAAT